MTHAAPPRLTLSQRWRRLRTSPRFPFVLFFGLLAAGGLSQAYCYWWDIRIERMLVRNKGYAERIHFYPHWLRKYLGHKFVARFEPIQNVRLRMDDPESSETHPHDLGLLRGALFLQELDFVGELSKEDVRCLRHLTGLKTARFWHNPELALDGVERLPKLTSLMFPFESSTAPDVYRRVACLKRLERFACVIRDDTRDSTQVEMGLRELARSQSLRRLDTRIVGDEQFLALASFFSDGSPSLPQLNELRIAGSKNVSPRGLDSLKNLPSLIHLDLSYSGIANDRLASLKELPYLRTLYLEANPNVTDDGVVILASMHNLQSLNVKRTGITFEGLLRLASLPRLRCLRADPGGSKARAELRKRLPAGCELDAN